MKNLYFCIIHLILVSFITATSFNALANQSEYRVVKLPYSISLEAPSHWKILSIETRSNLRAAGEAVLKNSGASDNVAKKESLLAMNATPNPTGAMIRVSATFPLEYSQSDLSATTAEELNNLRPEILAMLKQAENNGGPKVLEVNPPRIEKINGKYAFVISYIRADINNEKHSWLVTQYKIPNHDHLIEFTLSHRQADSALWKPIMERVKRSLKF